MARTILFFLYFFVVGTSGIGAESPCPEAAPKAYAYNPYVDLQLWRLLAPYFLPEAHPVKEKLDQIFLTSKRRVLKNKKSMEKERFKVVYHEKKQNPYVSKHRAMPGYLFKAYLDSQDDVADGMRFFARIAGAEAVRQAIVSNGYEAIFKVPRKWIYPVPVDAIPPTEGTQSPKNFILVVEDMDILGFEKNLEKWKSNAMTPELLQAIYRMLDEVGLSDTVYAFNLPFCKDGKLAFIDTEYYHDWPVDFGYLVRFLNISMGYCWFIIIERGGG